MPLFKSVIISFCFAVIMLVAKPFIGFNASSQVKHLTHLSICVKAFTKRKQEFVENGSFDVLSIQKKLADPAKQFFLLFSFLLGIILPFVFAADNISNRFLRKLQLSLSPRQHTYLLNSALII
ncbi:hypothetical protein [Mucilaginibacter sp. OK098]|uniref:hypothetical protein n=1 Tax=Mucilaginibacter sp. OK098 TaxID=1855297 RepID=UPI0009177F72|nr:hypothetical protein [Mucilaginibacter sp. OK098]SHM09007.1 hypothetical protein SAMN05216524_101768 [Mucilaginibacter sp. OK098]